MHAREVSSWPCNGRTNDGDGGWTNVAMHEATCGPVCVHGRAQPRGAIGEATSSLQCTFTWEQAKEDARRGRAIAWMRHSCNNKCKEGGNGDDSCSCLETFSTPIASSALCFPFKPHLRALSVAFSTRWMCQMQARVFMQYCMVCNGRRQVARGKLACLTLRCLLQRKTTRKNPNFKVHARSSRGRRKLSHVGPLAHRDVLTTHCVEIARCSTVQPSLVYHDCTLPCSTKPQLTKQISEEISSGYN